VLKSWIKKVGNNFENSLQGSRSRSKLKYKYTRLPCTRSKSRNISRKLCILQQAIIALSALGGTAAMTASFDTDSRPIRIDNCATACISNRIEDFVGPLQPSSRQLQGIGNAMGDLQEGTIHWDIEDDDGITHKFIIPNSIYVLGAFSRLLSPQHVAQERKDYKPNRYGTWCATYDDKVVFWWDQEKYKRTVPLDKGSSNVGTFTTAPGFSRFNAFCTECKMEEEADIIAFETHVIEDSDSEDEAQGQDSEGGIDDEEQALLREEPLTTDFKLDGPNLQDQDSPTPNIIEDEEDQMPQDASAEFLRWHHKLGHISPKRMQLMAKAGTLPKRLATCPVPLCTSCLYGKATRRPWRTKSPKNKEQQSKSLTAPGDCVSIDQMISTTPGLIAQLRGIPTKARYKVVTVFVDQFSGLSYVHAQRTTNAEETM
jgi:hypothetical protein